jgi:hypothetical protein
MIIFRSTPLRMRNVQDKRGIENQNAHLTANSIFLIRAIYEIMWKNTARSDRPHMAIRRIRFTCRMTKAKYRHTLRLFNTHFFSTATTVTWTRLNATLYGHLKQINRTVNWWHFSIWMIIVILHYVYTSQIVRIWDSINYLYTLAEHKYCIEESECMWLR